MITWRTDNIELAVRALAQQGRIYRTLVRCDCRLHRPIRIRPRLVADLIPYVVKWNTGASQIDQWQKLGGVLLDYVAVAMSQQRPAHEAQVLVECPDSRATLAHATAVTSGLTVIYRPPTWSGHREMVQDRYPSIALCTAFWNAICESPRVSDEALRSSMHLRTDQFRRIRKSLLPASQFTTTTTVSLRVEPDDGVLRDVYRAIKASPVGDGSYLLDEAKCKAAAQFWKAALRILQKRGHVAIKDRVTQYRLDGVKPNFARIGKASVQAAMNLAEVIDYVDALPILQLPAGPAARTQSPVHARTLSEELAGDIPR